MKKTKVIRFRLPRLFCFLAAVALYPASSIAQDSFTESDTTLNTIINPIDKSIVPAAGNIEFPEILKGNEEQTLSYIEKFSERRRDYLIRMYSKGKKLLPKAAGILKKYQLPEEFKVLMILESAYNPNAVSKAGAVGYWQFMDAVAKEYGLKYIPQERKEKALDIKKKKKGRKSKEETTITVAVTKEKKKKGRETDDRKNFQKATVAAARYLCDRKRNLNSDWLLIVASYNCGVGNVWEAMEKSGKENPGFWDIKELLPAETQAYVMNFITLNVVYKNYDKFLKNQLRFSLPACTEDPCDNFEETVSSEICDVTVTPGGSR